MDSSSTYKCSYVIYSKQQNNTIGWDKREISIYLPHCDLGYTISARYISVYQFFNLMYQIFWKLKMI